MSFNIVTVSDAFATGIGSNLGWVDNNITSPSFGQGNYATCENTGLISVNGYTPPVPPGSTINSLSGVFRYRVIDNPEGNNLNLRVALNGYIVLFNDTPTYGTTFQPTFELNEGQLNSLNDFVNINGWDAVNLSFWVTLNEGGVRVRAYRSDLSFSYTPAPTLVVKSASALPTTTARDRIGSIDFANKRCLLGSGSVGSSIRAIGQNNSNSNYIGTGIINDYDDGGSLTYSSSGKGSFIFDKSNANSIYFNAANIQIGLQSLIVESWFKRANNPSTNGQSNIWSLKHVPHDIPNDGLAFRHYIDNFNNRFVYLFRSDSNSNQVLINSGDTNITSEDGWVQTAVSLRHYAGVWYMRVYLNGSLFSQQDQTFNHPDYTYPYFTIGRNLDVEAVEYPVTKFEGNIGIVNLYKFTGTDQEADDLVLQNYKALKHRFR